MKKIICLIVSFQIGSFSIMQSQKSTNYENKIISSDLESFVSFLASPLLKGRMNGEEGLDIAGQYIASQAKLIGLKPANGNSFFQPYIITNKKTDRDRTMIQIISEKKDTVTSKDVFFQLEPKGPSDFIIEGDVVFAGYGINSDSYKYNDFRNLAVEGKILLVMTRAPLSEDGSKFLLEDSTWSDFTDLQYKLSTLLFTRARAVLLVMDPKSGFSSFDEQYPDYAAYLTSDKLLKGEKKVTFEIPGMPEVMFINRSVADDLLKDSGHTLVELQNKIDKSLQPQSFVIPGRKIRITEASETNEMVLNNVAGYIEGSDPIIKNEIVIYSAHYDHIGTSGNEVYTGADDNASGCAALLSMAEAFQTMEKKPLRSVLFLWVSGEEIGLYGSKTYIDRPLFPIEKTVVDLNMDMIGRVKGIADSTIDNPMTGPKTIFVISDNQSKELLAIADSIDSKSPLDFDYSLSGKDHPLQLFARSDHYNFVKKDIPVLFFSSGLHTDYHTTRDRIEKLDFKKMELVTRTMFDIGLTIANKKTRLVVDYPFSSW
jgi:hypothetical protein